jgi:hypothetical protein
MPMRIWAATLSLNLVCIVGLSQEASSKTDGNKPDSAVLVMTVSIPNPIDVKWTATSNLYVLSGDTATITEFDGNGRIIRSVKGVGNAPSGFDVDNAGKIYVAMAGDNQVLKFNQTEDSFVVDAQFCKQGFIGNADKSPGNKATALNRPLDVAVTTDGREISIADSGNNRVQHFSKDGLFIDSFGNAMGKIGSLNGPQGLTYDFWNTLAVADSGNNRLIVASDLGVQKASGGAGANLGQFQAPWHLCAGKRGLYVADTGNNRVQVFAPISSHELSSNDALRPRLAISKDLKLNHPQSVAAVADLLEEKIYIADTGNNRVILVKLALDNPEAVWKSMKEYLAKGDIPGAISCFSIASRDEYMTTFSSMSKAKLLADAKNIGNLKPVSIENDKAQYYFEGTVNGMKVTFPIAFVKENEKWKILEY